MPSLTEIIETEAANTSLDDIKDVPPIPVGSYLCQIVGHHENVKSSRQQTDGIRFKVRFLQAREDVEVEKLAEHLEASNRTLGDVTMNMDIWESPYALSSLRSLLRDTLGIDGSLGLKQALAEVPGKQFIATVTHRAVQSDGGVMRLAAQIGSTARAL